MNTVKVTSEMAARERLPNLLLGNQRTTNSALHNIKFIGKLEKWVTFEASVKAEFEDHQWDSIGGKRTTLAHRAPGGFFSLPSLRNEHVVDGDEGGLMGRWQQHVHQVVSAIYLDQGLDLTLGDFRASTSRYRKIPDIACMVGVQHLQSLGLTPPLPEPQPGLSPGDDLRYVGEMKVFWVNEHRLSQAVHIDYWIRHIFGQIAEYMRDLGLKYGVMTIYSETIFLRQEQTAAGDWELQYSPIVQHKTTASKDAISLRQAMWYLGVLAATEHAADNKIPKDQWVARNK